MAKTLSPEIIEELRWLKAHRPASLERTAKARAGQSVPQPDAADKISRIVSDLATAIKDSVDRTALN
jgi:hypothetical protein